MLPGQPDEIQAQEAYLRAYLTNPGRQLAILWNWCRPEIRFLKKPKLLSHGREVDVEICPWPMHVNRDFAAKLFRKTVGLLAMSEAEGKLRCCKASVTSHSAGRRGYTLRSRFLQNSQRESSLVLDDIFCRSSRMCKSTMARIEASFARP